MVSLRLKGLKLSRLNEETLPVGYFFVLVE
jgi:hypothetical protein